MGHNWVTKHSTVPNNCPSLGIWPLLQFSHSLGTDPVLLTLLFFPSSLHPTEFCVDLYIPFPWSEGTLDRSQLAFCQDFLCLKVYSWCICEERCNAHPPSPPPSSLLLKSGDFSKEELKPWRLFPGTETNGFPGEISKLVGIFDSFFSSYFLLLWTGMFITVILCLPHHCIWGVGNSFLTFMGL